MVADEIECLTPGGDGTDVWTTFSGKVESVSACALAARRRLAARPGPDRAGAERVRRGLEEHGGVGDTAYVEGLSQPGYVQATRLVVNKR